MKSINYLKCERKIGAEFSDNIWYTKGGEKAVEAGVKDALEQSK